MLILSFALTCSVNKARLTKLRLIRPLLYIFSVFVVLIEY